ncbi:MAG TPA: hypothetical protein VGA30_06795 [Actinomycetota bacterium]
MTIDERSRHALYLKLEEVLGSEDAEVLMEHLPPVGWADVATKRDLDHLAVATKRDLDQLAVATKRDLDQLAAITRKDLRHLGERFDAKLDVTEQRVLATIRQELSTQITNQTRALMLTFSATLVSVAGVAFAAAKLT